MEKEERRRDMVMERKGVKVRDEEGQRKEKTGKGRREAQEDCERRGGVRYETKRPIREQREKMKTRKKKRRKKGERRRRINYKKVYKKGGGA